MSLRTEALRGKLALPTEHQEQIAVCNWLDFRRVVYFAVPNGGKRNVVVGKKLKAEGVKKGVPDLIILTPPPNAMIALGGARLPCCGAAVEMKRRKGGVVSEEQSGWLATFAFLGWATIVANGADDAIKQLEEWGY